MCCSDTLSQLRLSQVRCRQIKESLALTQNSEWPPLIGPGRKALVYFWSWVTPNASMTPHEFIARWSASELKERSASQERFIDRCPLLGELTPAEAGPTGETYCFERGARKDTGGDGWADVWKRHHSMTVVEAPEHPPTRGRRWRLRIR